ncbi:2OG-Fe(II) oxygenase [Halomonas halocynthiae]|uniref:2OG-Fe(II) oxygenase n=1 Tax=Halomonas halocynthiae TaxID=176290 RepID=UPI0003F93B28|nr:2OG-Fe(II) oxygenase [Halomonas halocynthiae]
MNPTHTLLPEHRLNELINALVEQGWYVGHDFISPSLHAPLFDEVMRKAEHNALTAAGIGRGRDHHRRTDIRGDTIQWLNRESQAQRRYLDAMGELQQALNKALFLGLFEYEAHFAYYPAGAFYKRHLDSFRGRANRVISTVSYLNPDWPSDAGGEMAIFTPETAAPVGQDCEEEQQIIARVQPKAGTFACFLSEQIPHAVLPTRLPRASIAGWFRVNTSLNSTVDPAH